MVLLSEIIEIIARSSDILCILWTKGRSLLHDLRITSGLGRCVPCIPTQDFTHLVCVSQQTLTSTLRYG